MPWTANLNAGLFLIPEGAPGATLMLKGWGCSLVEGGGGGGGHSGDACRLFQGSKLLILVSLGVFRTER